MENFDRIAYIGDRDAIGKEWNRRRYVFKWGKVLAVPDDFARLLLSSPNFIRESQVGRCMDESFPDGARLLMRRWGALGDLIIFRAACAGFIRTAEAHYEFILRLQTQYAHVFGHDDLWDGLVPIGTPSAAFSYDGVVPFDQVAEQDHGERTLHRLDLFLEAMSKRKIVITPEDWKIPIPEGTEIWVDRYLTERGLNVKQRDRPLVGVQIRGSTRAKTLPSDVMFKLIGELRDRGNQVILIENDQNVAERYLIDNDVYAMTGRDVLHGISLLGEVDLAITMDSGALWMAHVAACPTLVILGPTRPEQRINYHPLYPELARAVCLNDLIDCPPCFESGKQCGQKFTCMQKQPDWNRAIGVILNSASSILDVRRTKVPLAASIHS